MIEERSDRRPVCPVTFALEIFGDRWTLLVLRDLLLEGRTRFSDFVAANPGLATNILTDRLKRLEGRGLLQKVSDPSDARRYVYLPTDDAVALIPMLVEMIAWSGKQAPGTVPAAFLKRIETEREALIVELQKQATNRIRQH